MSSGVRPLNQTVKDAIRRQKSAGRHAGPVAAALLHAGMFLALCGGVLAGAFFLWRAALEDPRFRMDGSTLGLGGSVRQCPESVAEMRAIGLAFNGRSLLDPLLSSDLEKAYAKSVWVKKVVKMRRRFPNRIDVELQLRMPVAQVKSDGLYWLVDADGILLPVRGQEEAFPRLPEILGVTSGMIRGRPEYGGLWSDEGVRGGLGIMRAFWASPLMEAMPIARVVVNAGVFKAGNNAKEIRRRFEVVSASGAVVRWGTYNEAEVEEELTSLEKMWHLQKLLQDEAALKPGVCFDVRTRLPGFLLLE